MLPDSLESYMSLQFYIYYNIDTFIRILALNDRLVGYGVPCADQVFVRHKQ